jgi:hypothetical protein
MTYGGGGPAGVVADAEALVGGAEDDLGHNDEARDAARVDLSSRDGGAAGIGTAGDLIDGEVDRWLADFVEPLGELPGGAAGGVGLGRRGVADDLPLSEVAGGELGCGEHHRRREAEVTGGDGSDAGSASGGVDVGVVVGGQTAGADHDRDAVRDRRKRDLLGLGV